MFERIMRIMDWIAIPIGGLALVLSLFGYDCDCFTMIAGGLCLLYLAYAGYLRYYRPKFDWHLIHGHFLRKVIAFVLLTPSFAASLYLLFSPNYSPKNLVYDENLYTYENSDTTNLGCISSEIFTDSVFIKAHNLYVSRDSVVMQTNKLPENIISKQEDPSIFWTVYYHFIDPGNQHMTTSPSGRGCSALIAILGVFLLNGLLVSSIIGWIDRRKEKWLNGDIRYKVRHLGKYKYAVVIGANEIAASVIKNLFTPKKEGEINFKCEGDNRYVILQTSRNTEDVRIELASHLSEDLLRKVIIYKASRDSINEIEHLHIAYSTEIYVLGESTLIDGGESFHDAMNMRCVNLIAKMKELKETKENREKEKRKLGLSVKKVCKVMFEYQTTSSIFQFSDITKEIKANLIFIPFNRYESWARAVIADNAVIEDCNSESENKLIYTPLDGIDSIKEDSDEHIHFVVVGMSRMGVAMGVQAMYQAHYLNFAKAETEENAEKRNSLKEARRTRITFIDTNADKEMAFFKGRYETLFSLTRHRYIDVNLTPEKVQSADSSLGWICPDEKWAHLSPYGENFIDIEVEFVKGEIESDGVRTYLKKISDQNNKWANNSKLTIAICLTQTHQAIAASLYMPIDVYEKAQEIWVYQRESADIVSNLTNTSQTDKRYKKLKPFGMLYSEYMSDRSQYLKALLVNGAYDLNGTINGIDIKAEDRDLSKKDTYPDLRETWKDLSIDKKYSNRYFADAIPQKIRMVNAAGLSNTELKNALKEHSETLARSEHNRWNVQQLLLGYSPCHKDIDDEFIVLNADCKANQESYKKWKNDVKWSTLSPKARSDKKRDDPEYKKIPKGIFDERKKYYKEGKDRMHPNLCAYAHLDKVDFEAKQYDIDLNNIIPTIKLLVDDKIEITNSNVNNV